MFARLCFGLPHSPMQYPLVRAVCLSLLTICSSLSFHSMSRLVNVHSYPYPTPRVRNQSRLLHVNQV